MICVYCRKDYEPLKERVDGRFCSERCKGRARVRDQRRSPKPDILRECPCGATYTAAQARALCDECKDAQSVLAHTHTAAAKRARVLRRAVGDVGASAVAQALQVSSRRVIFKFVGREEVSHSEAAICTGLMGQRPASSAVTIEQLMDRTVSL